jgi:hypothetical protein
LCGREAGRRTSTGLPWQVGETHVTRLCNVFIQNAYLFTVKDGYLEYHLYLGKSGTEMTLKSRIRVDDGQRHSVVLSKYKVSQAGESITDAERNSGETDKYNLIYWNQYHMTIVHKHCQLIHSSYPTYLETLSQKIL